MEKGISLTPTQALSMLAAAMKLLFLPLVLFFSFIVSAKEFPVVEPKAAGMSAEKLAAVDAALEKLVADRKIAGCVVAVARRGEIAYFKAFGKADIEADKPMTTDAVFRIFSMTKAITSASALMLVEEGKIALDDPIGKHLPALADLEVYHKSGNTKADPQPTVRDLLRHTAGFSYGWGLGPVDKLYGEKGVMDGTLDELVARLGGIPLLYQPGTEWNYSAGTDVLGALVEKVSGQALDAFFRERIFEPLDMRDSGFSLPTDKAARLTANYSGALKPIEKPSESAYLKAPKMRSGGGGLVSTARDYLRFLQMIANGGELEGKRLLKAETVKLMTTNQLPEGIKNIAIGLPRPGIGFGLGFSVRTKETKLWDAAAPLGEFGWGGAASTHYWVSPKDELVVVAMQQQMPYNFIIENTIKALIYDAMED